MRHVTVSWREVVTSLALAFAWTTRKGFIFFQRMATFGPMRWPIPISLWRTAGSKNKNCLPFFVCLYTALPWQKRYAFVLIKRVILQVIRTFRIHLAIRNLTRNQPVWRRNQFHLYTSTASCNLFTSSSCRFFFCLSLVTLNASQFLARWDVCKILFKIMTSSKLETPPYSPQRRCVTIKVKLYLLIRPRSRKTSLGHIVE